MKWIYLLSLPFLELAFGSEVTEPLNSKVNTRFSVVKSNTGKPFLKSILNNGYTLSPSALKSIAELEELQRGRKACRQKNSSSQSFFDNLLIKLGIMKVAQAACGDECSTPCGGCDREYSDSYSCLGFSCSGEIFSTTGGSGSSVGSKVSGRACRGDDCCSCQQKLCGNNCGGGN
jgi:hypothetical protein